MRSRPALGDMAPGTTHVRAEWTATLARLDLQSISDTITLVTANETVTLPRSEVVEHRQSAQSMIPEDLWTPLSEHEVRSLVKDLASPAQVLLPPTESGHKPK